MFASRPPGRRPRAGTHQLAAVTELGSDSRTVQFTCTVVESVGGVQVVPPSAFACDSACRTNVTVILVAASADAANTNAAVRTARNVVAIANAERCIPRI